jgi:hypothetical protein
MRSFSSYSSQSNTSTSTVTTKRLLAGHSQMTFVRRAATVARVVPARRAAVGVELCRGLQDHQPRHRLDDQVAAALRREDERSVREQRRVRQELVDADGVRRFHQLAVRFVRHSHHSFLGFGFRLMRLALK